MANHIWPKAGCFRASTGRKHRAGFRKKPNRCKRPSRWAKEIPVPSSRGAKSNLFTERHDRIPRLVHQQGGPVEVLERSERSRDVGLILAPLVTRLNHPDQTPTRGGPMDPQKANAANTTGKTALSDIPRYPKPQDVALRKPRGRRPFRLTRLAISYDGTNEKRSVAS